MITLSRFRRTVMPALAAALALAVSDCAENGILMPLCGDGTQVSGEQCDDGNPNAGDGCNATCATETGFTCTGTPSNCTTTCGDGIRAGAETCDDGNAVEGDGCSELCAIENATGIQPTLASIQQHVFDPICSTCHYSNGGSIPYLESRETSYASLVGVESYVCSNGMGGWAPRVYPGFPDDSCLVMVIVGDNGAGGFVMPPYPMRPLNASQIAAIREWIARGAAP